MKKNVTLAGIVAAGLISAGTAAASDLPRSMVWSSYDVGSSGYVEASAIADALSRAENTRIRIMPSGTAIGRMLPMRTGRVDYGFLANEVWFATEALYDFAAQEWGPQDLRVLLGRPASFGMAVAGDAGIETLEDLRGQRVAYVQANPSVNIKVEAMLALAGLTWDDVDRVVVPSFAASTRGLIEGTVDAAGTVTTGANLYELESSPRGIVWPDLPPDSDTAAWDRLREVAPIFEAMNETIGAGLSKDNPAILMSYRYPMVTVYADRSEEEIYALTRAVVEHFDLYSDVSAAMPRWHVDVAGTPPTDAPFHEGAIRYLHEIGVWTEAHDAWNAERLERLEQVIAEWERAQDAALEEQVPGNRWVAFWEEWRAENLD